MPLMLLEGKKGLVLNALNKHSIAWAIADAANRNGAQVGVGVQSERFREGVIELFEGRERFDTFLIDFSDDAQFDLLAENVQKQYGKIDFLVHCAAYAPKAALNGRVIDVERDDYMLAMNISAYSLIRLCRALEPVFNEDASISALSFIGSTRAAKGYNVMGVCKAALESTMRYMAVELGDRGIRVNTLSPGPIRTVAASGVPGLREKIKHVQEESPLRRTYGQEEVAGTAVYLMSDLSRGITGQIFIIDSGYSIVGV